MGGKVGALPPTLPPLTIETSPHQLTQFTGAPSGNRTCSLHGLFVHDECIFINAPEHGLCDVVRPEIAEEISVLAVAVLHRQLLDSLKELIMKHKASGFQLVMCHFKVGARMQK